MGLSKSQRFAAANIELRAIAQVDQIEAGKVPTIKYDDTYAFHDELYERKYMMKFMEKHTSRDFFSGRMHTSHVECKRAKKCFEYIVDHGNGYRTLNSWTSNDLVPSITTIEEKEPA